MPRQQLSPEQRRMLAARRAAILQRQRIANQRRQSRRRPIGNAGSNFLSGILSGLGLLVLAMFVLSVVGKLPHSGSDQGNKDSGNKGACANAPNTATLTRFLQALALQESGGRPRADNNGIAYGKYQYIDDTWHATAQKYYPPADNYGHASQAPEEVQDAVAYIEYFVKYRDFGGDLTRLAVSHYFPAALKEAWRMDVIPFPDAGNVLTPRQYAERFIQKMKSGAGSNIPIKASSAPDFEKHLAKVGGKC